MLNPIKNLLKCHFTNFEGHYTNYKNHHTNFGVPRSLLHLLGGSEGPKDLFTIYLQFIKQFIYHNIEVRIVKIDENMYFYSRRRNSL